MNTLTRSLNGSNGNGSRSHTSAQWQRQTVQQFFSTCNWENQPPALQELKAASRQPATTLSLDLKVRDFLAAVNWDNSTIAARPAISQPPPPDSDDNFTLDSFSDLF